MEKISFLIPVYNAEKYLDSLMSSILSQELDEYEIILLDDGSTDGSLAKCNEYQAMNPDTIKVISRENKGAVRTRRELFESSTGEWIWIIDSDDYIASDAIKELSGIIESEKCDLILFDYYLLSYDNDSLEIIHQLDSSDGTKFDLENKTELYRLFFTESYINPLWNKVFRRKCIDFNNDYTEYEDVRRANDMLQTMAILTNAEDIVYVKKPLYYYRIVEGSLSRVYKDYTYYSITKVLKTLDKYAKIWGISDEMREQFAESKINNICEMLTKYVCSENIKPSIGMYTDFINNIYNDPFYGLAIKETPLEKYRGTILFKLIKEKRIRILYVYIKLRGKIKPILERIKRIEHIDKVK